MLIALRDQRYNYSSLFVTMIIKTKSQQYSIYITFSIKYYVIYHVAKINIMIYLRHKHNLTSSAFYNAYVYMGGLATTFLQDNVF